MKGKTKANLARHKPPSRTRYEASHPVVSFRVKKELYQQLKNLLAESGTSIGDFFRKALAVQRADTNRAYQRGYNKGYVEARNLYRVTYLCDICGETIEITSPNEKRAAAQYMEEHRWGHAACHEERRRQDY